MKKLTTLLTFLSSEVCTSLTSLKTTTKSQTSKSYMEDSEITKTLILQQTARKKL